MKKKNIFLFTLLAVVLLTLVVGGEARTQNVSIERVSVHTNGNAADRAAQEPVISNDGRYIAFWTAATNLVDNDTNDEPDVFIHDRVLGITERISINSSGIQGNGWSDAPSISANGRLIAFKSTADNLVVGDTNRRADVFVRDLVANTTEIVSISSSGELGPWGASRPDISGDGRFVTFASNSDFMNDGANNLQIYMRDRFSNSTVRVSEALNGSPGNHGSENPSISSDGRYIAFESRSTNLVLGKGDSFTTYIYVHDLETGSNEFIARGDLSVTEGISGNGQFITFYTSAQLVSQDTNDELDIYVFNRDDGSLELISQSTAGTVGNQDSAFPAISDDGRYVAFHSIATNLVLGDTNSSNDVFLHDRIEQTIERISLTENGDQAENGSSTGASISENGKLIVFKSLASLTSDDNNFEIDAYVYYDSTNGILLTESLYLPIAIR